ncbi:MAG: DCC1-like thiol-disulfide oxidoreductase family protein [Acidobacteriota bacterium]
MTGLFSTARRGWMRFWFEPSAPTCLGVSRLLFFLPLAAFYIPHDFSAWASVSPDFYQPIWLFDRFRIPVFGPAVLVVLQIGWKLSLVLACLGLFTRVSTGAVAVFGTYLLGLPHNFGQVYHFDAVLVLAFWILAFSRAGDAWSIDSLIRAARQPQASPLPPSPEYTWPTQLILTALSLVFFAAGIAKLWTSGADWVLSDHIAILLRRVQYHISDADPLVNWGGHIAEIPIAARLLALATVVTETLYPLALFSRRLRPLLVLGGIGLIVGIRLLMGPTFEQFLTINVFWVPWDRVGAWVTARLPRRTGIAVIFDGACGLCRPTVAVLRRLDLLRRVEFIDVHADWTTISRRFPSLSREACLADMHGVGADGRVHAGFDTYRALSRILPLGWLVRPFLYLPPVPWAGRRLYRRIADRRHASACALPAAPRFRGAGVGKDGAEAPGSR